MVYAYIKKNCLYRRDSLIGNSWRSLTRGDLSSFLQWWLAILGIGLVFLPLTNLIFYKFNDRGYLFSKTIGIAITGYFMWLFSSLGILKFNTSACIFSFALGIALNISILIYQNKEGS